MDQWEYIIIETDDDCLQLLVTNLLEIPREKYLALPTEEYRQYTET
jgi:hypothetical protein